MACNIHTINDTTEKPTAKDASGCSTLDKTPMPHPQIAPKIGGSTVRKNRFTVINVSLLIAILYHISKVL